jgi:hypothetical protein
MLDLVDRIRTQPEIDPVLQLALLRKVLELAVEGSEPLRETIGGFRNLVDQADVDVNVTWMDPDNREADRLRVKAAGVVRSLPGLAPARKEVLGRRARIEHLITRRIQTIGWLVQDASGWQVRSGSVLPQQGVLWVVMPREINSGVWRQIGTLDQGKPRLSQGDDPGRAQGRPVFFTSQNDSGS